MTNDAPSARGADNATHNAPDGRGLPLSWPMRVVVTVLTAGTLLGGFVLLMAAMGGLFALLAWPLRAWFDMAWLPAFGVVGVLFFAAGGIVAYLRISATLEEIRDASRRTADMVEAMDDQVEMDVVRRAMSPPPLRIVNAPARKRPRRSPKPENDDENRS